MNFQISRNTSVQMSNEFSFDYGDGAVTCAMGDFPPITSHVPIARLIS